MCESDAKAREEEMQALESIFGTDFAYLDVNYFEISLLIDKRLTPIILRCLMPDTYPSTARPRFELEADWLSPSTRKLISAKLDSIAIENIGNVVVFLWTDWIISEGSEQLSYLGIFQSKTTENNSILCSTGEVEADNVADYFDNAMNESLESNDGSELIGHSEDIVCLLKLDHMRQVFL